MDKISSVKVALRIRPAIVTANTERLIPKTCIQIVPDQNQVVIGTQESTRKSFTFDNVFGVASNQLEIYDQLAVPLVKQFLEGFNATILAYGQTYSGKTYTMGSNVELDSDPELVGIIPRVFHDIFSLDNVQDGMEHIYKVSFLEIYQEQIKDLLSGQNKDISIREKEGTIVLSGITERTVTCPEEMRECLVMGSQLRSTGDTLMHSHSSRSHAIFTVTLEKVSKLVHDPQFELSPVEPVIVQRSKLHLVDLAGSERLKRTGAEGVRLKESVKINSGLLALGNVISILGDEKHHEEKQHVPYRDSKLTRLLQDSLGGNSQTVMLACVSPLESDLDETMNTLKYAYRARKIQNKPIVNTVDQIALERTTMQHKIEELEGKLKGMKDHGIAPTTIVPEMIDFDNEQWMQYFMEQLKIRTIRGTNAVKALETANQENQRLRQEISNMNNDGIAKQLQISHDSIQKEFEELKSQSVSWKKSLQSLLQFCLKIVKGQTPSSEEHEEIKALLKRHYPSEQIEEMKKSNSGLFPPIHPTGTSTRAPSTNSVARSHRRKRIGSEDHHDDIHLKPLETELRETRKYLAQMEDELSRTKIILHQNEAISAQSSKEIARLMQINDSLRERLLGVDPTGEVGEKEILSIKAVADAGIQTGESSETLNEIGSVAPVDSNPEKLIEELAIATKAKVDLLKELSKSNKESEKQRHVHADQVQKLEREIEVREREINKLQDEIISKDAAKEKLKEDLERKLRNQESAISKYKAKYKEIEKSIKLSNPDRKLQETQQEIDRLSIQIQNLKKKAKEEHEKYNELEARKAKELAVLSKQLEDEAKKSRQLEVKAEMIRKKFDRKVEENSSLTKKTRELSLSGIPTPKKVKAEVVEDRNEGSEAATASQVESEPVSDLETELTQNREKLERLEVEMKNADADRLEDLQEQKSDLVMKIGLLRIRKRQENSKQTSNGVEDLEWKMEEFQELFQRFAADDPLQRIIHALQSIDSHNARIFICDCLKEVADAKDHIVQLEFERTNLSNQVQEEKDQIEVLEKKSHKIIRSYEKKLAALEKSIQELSEPQKPSSANSGIQTEVLETPEIKDTKDLQKDVFYYRNANKELKSKLREVVAVNHRLAKTLQERAKTAETESPSFPVAVE